MGHARLHNTSHQNGGDDEIATATPAANAIPKAGAGGKLDGGWLPRKDWGASAADPVGTPTDGDTYYNTTLDMEMRYDSGRTKWLSVETTTLIYARSTVASGGYMQMGGVTVSATRGFIAPYNGTVIALGYVRSDSDAATFDLMAGGVSVTNIASAATSGTDLTKNANVSANAILAGYNSGANSASDVIFWARLRWRA